jgi:hypothetical protein
MSEYKVKIDKVIEDMAFIEAPDGRVITTGSKVATSHVMANLLNSETAALRSQIAEAQARIASQSDTIESLQTANYRLEMEIAAAEEMAERLSTEKSSALIEQGNLAAQLAEAQAKNARLVAERSWMLALIKNMPRMGHSSILSTVEEILKRASQAAPSEAPVALGVQPVPENDMIFNSPLNRAKGLTLNNYWDEAINIVKGSEAPKTCDACGNMLANHIDGHNGVYCSDECAFSAGDMILSEDDEAPKCTCTNGQRAGLFGVMYPCQDCAEAPADVTLTDEQIHAFATTPSLIENNLYFKQRYDTPVNRAAIEKRRKELGLI